MTFIEIPFYALQFIKKGDSFIATYQASIGISEKRGQDFEHVVWSDSIITDIYTDTRSAVKNRKHFTEFIVPTGNQYELIGELQDRDTRKKGILKKKIDYRSYDKTPSLLDPNYLLDLTGDWGFGKDKIPTRGFRVREIGDGVDVKITGFIDKGEYIPDENMLEIIEKKINSFNSCLLYTSPSPRDATLSRVAGCGW
mgnify:CR=1 FL=1